MGGDFARAPDDADAEAAGARRAALGAGVASGIAAGSIARSTATTGAAETGNEGEPFVSLAGGAAVCTIKAMPPAKPAVAKPEMTRFLLLRGGGSG